MHQSQSWTSGRTPEPISSSQKSAYNSSDSRVLTNTPNYMYPQTMTRNETFIILTIPSKWRYSWGLAIFSLHPPPRHPPPPPPPNTTTTTQHHPTTHTPLTPHPHHTHTHTTPTPHHTPNTHTTHPCATARILATSHWQLFCVNNKTICCKTCSGKFHGMMPQITRENRKKIIFKTHVMVNRRSALGFSPKMTASGTRHSTLKQEALKTTKSFR